MSVDTPKVNVVLRTELARIPELEEDTDRREFSRVLIVPSKYQTLACATDARCIAVVGVQGEASEEATVDLAVLQHATVGFPLVVNREGDDTEVFRGVEIDGKWKPIGPRFRVEDKSSVEKFPNTVGIIEPLSTEEEWIVVRFDPDLLCKLAEALTEDRDDLRVRMLIPKSRRTDKIAIQTNAGIGVMMGLSEESPGDDEIVERFNAAAVRFNDARKAARKARDAKGGAS